MRRYVMDENKDWEGRYKDLEQHHIEETRLLLSKIKKLREELNETESAYCDLEDELNQFRWDHEDK